MPGFVVCSAVEISRVVSATLASTAEDVVVGYRLECSASVGVNSGVVSSALFVVCVGELSDSVLSAEVVRSGEEIPPVLKPRVLPSSTVLSESGVVFFELVAASVVSPCVVNVEAVSRTLVTSALVLSREGVAMSEVGG